MQFAWHAAGKSAIRRAPCRRKLHCRAAQPPPSHRQVRSLTNLTPARDMRDAALRPLRAGRLTTTRSGEQRAAARIRFGPDARDTCRDPSCFRAIPRPVRTRGAPARIRRFIRAAPCGRDLHRSFLPRSPTQPQKVSCGPLALPRARGVTHFLDGVRIFTDIPGRNRLSVGRGPTQRLPAASLQTSVPDRRVTHASASTTRVHARARLWRL